MRFLSLFSGIGGFDLGLARAGMTCVGQVEINPYCLAVLKKHWPDVKRLENIKNVTGTEFGPFDLLCGGVPCQPASTAGKRRGQADDRWLWPDTFRIVRVTKPAWCVFENVRGLLSLNQGVVFDSLLTELESYGYEVQAFCIPACAVNAPHRRERVWILGRRKDADDPQGRGCRFLHTPDIWQASGEINTLTNADSLSSDISGGVASHPAGVRCHGHDVEGQGIQRTEQTCGETRSGNSAGIATNTSCQGLPVGQRSEDRRGTVWDERQAPSPSNWGESWLEVATRLCGVDDGLPGRVDRLRCLGNSVVPQVVTEIGKAILLAEADV